MTFFFISRILSQKRLNFISTETYLKNISPEASTLPDEFEGHAVHTVSQTRRFWTIVKDVSEVRVAPRAQDFRARLAEAVIHFLTHVPFINGSVKARPTRMRIKLGARTEQGQFTRNAFKDSTLVNVVERA
jgi:hypothetical protein